MNILKLLFNKFVKSKNNTGRDYSDHHNYGGQNNGICNIGNRNNGNFNTGCWNIGDWNSGDQNIGQFNSGNKNIGQHNSGDENFGDCNTGHWNTGDYNSGLGNYGDHNVGFLNQGMRCSGVLNSTNDARGMFCTQEQPLIIFDQPTNIMLSDFIKTEAFMVLNKLIYEVRLRWIYPGDMTPQEKEKQPGYKKVGGILKERSVKEISLGWWKALTEEEKEIIKNIPNFDPEKFKNITGIEI